jgi:hypothetical protein
MNGKINGIQSDIISGNPGDIPSDIPNGTTSGITSGLNCGINSIITNANIGDIPSFI